MRIDTAVAVLVDEPTGGSLPARAGSSSGRDQVTHKDEGLPWCDHAPGAPVPVGQTRGNDQLAAAAGLHSLHALVPAGDDPPSAELELQGFAPVPARVEFLARRERDPDIVNLDYVARVRRGPIALPDVPDLQAGRRLAAGKVDLRLADAHTRPSLQLIYQGALATARQPRAAFRAGLLRLTQGYANSGPPVRNVSEQAGPRSRTAVLASTSQ